MLKRKIIDIKPTTKKSLSKLSYNFYKLKKILIGKNVDTMYIQSLKVY